MVVFPPNKNEASRFLETRNVVMVVAFHQEREREATW